MNTKELSDAEIITKLQHQKQRFYKAEKMFESESAEFQYKHYKDLCKVLDNIVALDKERLRRGGNVRPT